MYLTLTLNRSCILESQTAGSLQLEEKSEIQAHMIFANCELITLVSKKNETFQFRHSSCFRSLVLQLRPFA